MSAEARSTHKAAIESPDGKYFDTHLGGAPYVGYNTETGCEVGWFVIETRTLSSQDKLRIRNELDILCALDEHPHLVKFYDVWENEKRGEICYTTEILTTGTLRQYINRAKNIKLKVIKKWCRQILQTLAYLHSYSPSPQTTPQPIIHRDLKCDNISLNTNTDVLRIDGFALKSGELGGKGTPEFMAPELYEEEGYPHSEKVDVYSFGMVVLEMVTKEYPYEECQNAAQIWKKVVEGKQPDVLHRIQDPHIRVFIESCLAPQKMRLSASELLQHPFLAADNIAGDDHVVQVEPKIGNDLGPQSVSCIMFGTTGPTTNLPVQPPGGIAVPIASSAAPSSSTNINHVNNVETVVESTSGPSVNLLVFIYLGVDHRKKQIKFTFDLNQDQSVSIAIEMVTALHLHDGENTSLLITNSLEAKIDPIRKAYFASVTPADVTDESV